ncbi:MAG: DUF47 domain-containing protein [Elusimicrobia bacterium]|nr:DUF47 domain-containing protein [Elusimicrobiota bacterium]
MAISLIPKEEKFFDFFEAQAAHNVEATRLFKELCQKWSSDSPLIDKLRDIEHEADITTHEIIDKLNRTFITPFDREDIHALASELDDIVDLAQSVSIRMKLFKISEVPKDMVDLADILHQSAENVQKAIKELKHLSNPRRLLDYCIEINRLENAGDQALAHAVGRLFEGKPDPLHVIKWKEIYEAIEAAIDKCEDVANTIESILVKQS